MIIQTPDKHLTDQAFYSYAKFYDLVINDQREDKEEFSLKQLSIGEEEEGEIFNRLYLSFQVLEITVDIEEGYKFDDEIVKAKKEAETRPEKEKNSLLKIIGKIKKGRNIKIDDIGEVSWIWYEIYHHIRFTPEKYTIPEKIKDILKIEFGKYLDNFINDKLAIVRKNYYKFETQKRVLINLIAENRKVELYGNNFIITEEIDNDCVIKQIPDLCIVHAVYALQKLGYLKVVDIWKSYKYPENRNVYTDKSTDYINVNIILEDTFLEEIRNKYKKDHPKNILEGFDEKRGILKFAGQEIELAKKNKETDAVLLMKTLLKVKNDNWKFNDEILKDWGNNEIDIESLPKNKVYFAGQKINTAVALKTKIEDFIECNTSKARINPKYRKVAE